MKALLEEIASLHRWQLLSYRGLQGGDINEVFLLQCTQGDFVIKLNDQARFPGMFAGEAKGLNLLGSVAGVKTPHVIDTNILDSWAYLVLEYCPTGKPSTEFWESFTQSLAQLHQQTQSYFGLDHNNYIGSLPQNNERRQDLVTFFIEQRLEPQFILADQAGYAFSNRDHFYKRLEQLLPREASALIHGDLWNGNYLVSEEGLPIFIDPAVCYGPREMDLAMMQLFGGFPAQVYETYHEINPLQPNWKDRIPIWQLYYLLVHLNLFGRGYLPQVKQILARYS